MTALLLAALYTSTMQVESVAVSGGLLWAATAGGVEQYDLATGTRTRLFTTADGLQDNHVLLVHVDGALHARTGSAECVLGQLFRCTSAAPLPPLPPAAAPAYQGARETARVRARGHLIVGTTRGLWLDGRRITPDGQICGNHVAALAEFQGALWVGAFDAGLCVLRGGRFHAVAAPFRMVNDLHVSPQGLWVASAEGLYFTADGRRFRREGRVRERAANRIASSARWLFVTTPFALHALKLDAPDTVRRWPRPAGSTSLQAVAVSGKNVWLASEDAGVIRLRDGRFEAFDRASGLPSSWAVDVAAAPDGGVWVATLRDGALRLDARGNLVERADPSRWGLRLYPDRGRILFGTQQGLAGAALPDPHVHALLHTAAGLWVGTEGGLALLDAP
jgi:ligand-binding sensor domain-containing protein